MSEANMLTNIGSIIRKEECGELIELKNKKITIDELSEHAWKNIAPCWPLKNMVAANPLQGLEELEFESALTQAAFYYQQQDLPIMMQEVNRMTIKWCQAFFDEGQATIRMPLREKGLFASWSVLAEFDETLHGNNENRKAQFAQLSNVASEAIDQCIEEMEVPLENRKEFMTLMLTSLPGWASYIKYRTAWDYQKHTQRYPVTKLDYLAMRLIITRIIWPEAVELLEWHKKNNLTSHSLSSKIVEIEKNESQYRRSLLDKLYQQAFRAHEESDKAADAQFIFCIDVRSEPFRRALEKQGNYQTFGFAGFFGLLVSIRDQVSGESYASCPVLLTPKQVVNQDLSCQQRSKSGIIRKKALSDRLKRLYQELKYNFTTPFTLAEMLGLWSGLTMIGKTIFPLGFAKLSSIFEYKAEQASKTRPILTLEIDGDGISLADQCAYAESALRMMDLTRNFSSLVIICGHKSETRNNAYAAALDCGACGGHHGGGNAKILAAILNNKKVRSHLTKQNIPIADKTLFVAAEHNTTTDEVELYADPVFDESVTKKIASLQSDLILSRRENARSRAEYLDGSYDGGVMVRSKDWAQTRPEWGLARNAAFVIGPRKLTKDIDLEGRCFLHDYNWQHDQDGAILTTILTAPMVVAQWINMQYLFSTLDNIAFGGGSKITQNICGKIGIMQGNASDLMHGLPLQSVNKNDKETYHQPLRLVTIVVAPREKISEIISQQVVLKKLFGNAWVAITCIDPADKKMYHLSRDFIWQETPGFGG